MNDSATASTAAQDPIRTARGVVELRGRRLLVDGTPRVVMSGEVHYFRLRREDWAHRLDLLVEAGCDAVATYIPWLVHELPDGSIDLTGRTSEYRDLVGFLDLAAERGLMVVARPGPFVMAELKNEGIPFRVYRDHPRALPLGWDGRRGPTATLDYLHPGYLDAVEGWYDAVIPVLAERQWGRGGTVVAVQLDNEVGMLSWVTNTPELSDGFLRDFAEAVVVRLGRDEVTRTFGVDPGDKDAWAAWCRGGGTAGTEQQQLATHHALGAHHRDRYARYLHHLSRLAQTRGITDVPFVINLHGTGEGRGLTFPIAVSQLSASYAGISGVTSGSDHYLGELTVANVVDLYQMNTCMLAVHDADQPLTSLEFEAGTGDYGEDLSRWTTPETVDLKTRLCVAQGNRLINYYLFAGGHNPPLEEPVGDGNDRIAFTGERHGFAAPVGPEGQVGPGYDATVSAVRAVQAAGQLLADMDEEYDDLVLGFVPDHFLTEYAHPGSSARRAQVDELQRMRGMGVRDVLARSLLFSGHSFGGVDLSGAPTSHGADLDPRGPVVALGSAAYLGRAVQQRLADYVEQGGRLLLSGVLPTLDDDGSPCTVLAEALGLEPGERVEGGPDRFPSVRSVDDGAVEVRVGVLQHLRATGRTEVTELVTDVATGGPVVVEARTRGGGTAVVVACDYPAHLDAWVGWLDRLGVRRRVVTEGAVPGLVTTTTVDAAGQRLLHLVNVAPVEQHLSVTVGDVRVGGDDPVVVPARAGMMLPVGVQLDDADLVWSTAELAAPVDGSTVRLRRTSRAGAARLRTARAVCAEGVEVERDATGCWVTWPAGGTESSVVVTLGPVPT